MRCAPWLLASCLLCASCSRTGLQPGSSIGALEDVEETATQRSPLVVAASAKRGDRDALFLIAPLEEARGPYEVSEDNALHFAFAPGAGAFAFRDDRGFFLVREWPPAPRQLSQFGEVTDFAWVDATHLAVSGDTGIVLIDVEDDGAEPLVERAAETALAWLRPSPDGRYLVFAAGTTGKQTVQLLDLQKRSAAPKLIDVLPDDGIVAIAWAADSEHLLCQGYDKVLIDAHYRLVSVSTKQGVIGKPFEILAEDFGETPWFRLAPTGKALTYVFGLSDSAPGRLYWVDLTESQPSKGRRIENGLRGIWSHAGDALAIPGAYLPGGYVAEPRGNAIEETEVRPGGDDFLRRFDTPIWSADDEIVYFTEEFYPEEEGGRAFRSDLNGNARQIGNNLVTSLYVSARPECLALQQSTPTKELVVVDEARGAFQSVELPQLGAPRAGSEESRTGAWVNDEQGARGLVFSVSTPRGDALAWVEVNDCVPSTPVLLVPPQPGQTFREPEVSNAAPPEWKGHLLE